MAARIEAATRSSTPDLIDLHLLSARDLDPLLDEEIRSWHELLEWDFTKSAELVRRFVDQRALNGCALIQKSKVVGYTYFVFEDLKGLIGDLYVLRDFQTIENENRLLENALESLMGSPHVSRVESQLMMIDSGRERSVPAPRFLNTYDRNFMMVNLEQMPALRARHRLWVENWTESYQEAAAELIAAAYMGHVDSQINDQYRSVAGARRFLVNIMQYPGCGVFFKPASLAALDRETGRMSALCLASLVSPQCGHITQICVAPWVRGTGVGYELLRQSLKALRALGCRKTSLTVTASNREAVRLYENVGFVTARTFSAYVWEGF